MLSLLVSARTSTPAAAYAEVLRHLESILNGDIASVNPMHISTMGYQSVLQLLAEERKLFRSWFARYFWKNALEIAYAVLVFRYHSPALLFDAVWRLSIRYSDFRKFDDLLRMVVDCSDQQAADIRSYLTELHNAGDIFFPISCR